MIGSSSAAWQPGWRRGLIAFAGAALLTASAVTEATAANPGQDQVSRDFQKNLSLGPGQSFQIENKFGEVRIHAESGREVRIGATIRVQAGSHDEAESYAQKIQVDVQQTGDGVRVRTLYPEDERKWPHSGRNISYSVSYDVAIPVDAALFVRNSFGSVTANGMRGKSDIENSHGSVTVRDIGAARLNNSFGSIDLTGASGDTFINDNNGSVQASEIRGTLDLRNRFGSITVRQVQGAATITGGNGAVTISDTGPAVITTSFGSADVRNVRGDLTLHDNNGNVDISSVGGAAIVSNSFGNVNFADIKGRFECTTNNGRVKGSSPAGGAITIRNSFGNIELENIAGTLDAETSNGKIAIRDARSSVTLKTSFGAIEASNIPKGIRAVTGNGAIVLNDIGADAYAKTSFGSINADRINGNLTAEDSNGSVSAKDVKGDVTVTTSFAGVTLESIGGRITVDNQNGAILVTAARPASGGCRDIALKTSFSSIRVGIPDGAGYNLASHTSFGRITPDMPVTATGNIGGDSLNGTIGSGGCRLQLNNSNGSIEIVRAP
jgi:DUF4097 and DUF4098 domain-containing protein YvlB